MADVPTYHRKIKCPCSYILKPGRLGFEIKPRPGLKSDVSKTTPKEWGLKNWVYKRDRWGQKIPKWDDYYQPEITVGYAIKYIYDPKNHICKNLCRGRCLEGLGRLAYKGEKRLGKSG